MPLCVSIQPSLKSAFIRAIPFPVEMILDPFYGRAGSLPYRAMFFRRRSTPSVRLTVQVIGF